MRKRKVSKEKKRPYHIYIALVVDFVGKKQNRRPNEEADRFKPAASFGRMASATEFVSGAAPSRGGSHLERDFLPDLLRKRRL